LNCQDKTCTSVCNGSAPDGGSTTTKDGGGSSKTIPDCKNPTAAEQSTYTMCSACDTTSCESSVTAALNACPAFYLCFAAADCSDAAGLEDCQMNDEPVSCQTAIDTLATCQGTFCSFPCSGF
jgi:hypothetical protein